MVALSCKTYEEPACLTPANLESLRTLCGDAALDYVLVIGAFHFINRIADLLHVDSELLPERLRRFDLLRRLSVRLGSTVMARMDLAPREYRTTYEEAIANVTPAFTHAMGRPPTDELLALRPCPKVIEVLQLALEERDRRSSLDRAVLGEIHRTVEMALPRSLAETEGFHARPADAVTAFAFVGTRYAYRTTADMIAALRHAGYDDTGILDLAIAVADANHWARLHRLVGLASELFYVESRITPSRAAPAQSRA